ncbi:hypothetical protein NGM37_61255, partial [Streptomyces sp. TRM76130]|nr:hypothetical protein [Streptomyces sp. TRM76130]
MAGTVTYSGVGGVARRGGVLTRTGDGDAGPWWWVAGGRGRRTSPVTAPAGRPRGGLRPGRPEAEAGSRIKSLCRPAVAAARTWRSASSA